MEIKVTTQVDLKEYHLTNCHIREMEELFDEEEICSLQIGTQRAYFTESIRQTGPQSFRNPWSIFYRGRFSEEG